MKRFQIFLGPQRYRAFIALLGITGLISLVLNAVVEQYAWVHAAQTLLVVIFILGAAYLIGGRLPVEERKRWAGIIIPAFIAVVIGVVFVPHLSGLFLGLGFGWILFGIFVFQEYRAPTEYKQAIKYMRKREYAQAVEAMTRLIKSEPDDPNHYRFRAELFRLWGKLKKAQSDYEKMVKLDSQSAVAYNGLAEVYLQSGKFVRAHEAAQHAYTLAPDEWVTAYNLGMIEDRLGEAESVIQHLQKALELNIPDARHRVLVYLYLSRAYQRLEQEQLAQTAVDNLGKHKNGLEEWQMIMSSEDAAALRSVLQEDINTAQALIDNEGQLSELLG